MMQRKAIYIAAILLALIAASVDAHHTRKNNRCVCPRHISYICGTNGATYSNSCVARCRGVRVACHGHCPCKKPCICHRAYYPVCGKNGYTYNNNCLAKCGGTDVACTGKCPCKVDCIKEHQHCSIYQHNVYVHPSKRCCSGYTCCATYSRSSYYPRSGVCRKSCHYPIKG